MVKPIRFGGLELMLELELIPTNTDKKIIKRLKSLNKKSIIYGMLKIGNPTFLDIYCRKDKEEKRIYMVSCNSYQIFKVDD